MWMVSVLLHACWRQPDWSVTKGDSVTFLTATKEKVILSKYINVFESVGAEQNRCRQTFSSIASEKTRHTGSIQREHSDPRQKALILL